MEAKQAACPLTLILDNNPDERVELYSVLDREGFLVATRSNPIDALKYASECKPAVVVVAGPLTPSQCRAVVGEMHTVSPRSRLVVARGEEELFALGGLAAEPYVTVLRGVPNSPSFRQKMVELLRQFTSELSVAAMPA